MNVHYKCHPKLRENFPRKEKQSSKCKICNKILYKCKFCDKFLASVASRTNHQRNYHHDQHVLNKKPQLEGMYPCGFCGIKYASRQSRWNHKRRAHNN
jgi:hypothetical protein